MAGSTQTTPSLTAWLSPQTGPRTSPPPPTPHVSFGMCLYLVVFFNQLRPFFWHFHFLCDPSGVFVAVSLSQCVLRGGHVCGKAVVRPAVGTHLLPLPCPPAAAGPLLFALGLLVCRLAAACCFLISRWLDWVIFGPNESVGWGVYYMLPWSIPTHTRETDPACSRKISTQNTWKVVARKYKKL